MGTKPEKEIAGFEAAAEILGLSSKSAAKHALIAGGVKLRYLSPRVVIMDRAEVEALAETRKKAAEGKEKLRGRPKKVKVEGGNTPE